ncbi:fibril biogenesis regulator DifG [Corallococcus praedator]|uniref:Fibril biogenesis regulator DifG n=1 Tax=Corallococcus praedator TaxID=2316724 RepID=A0ABX9QGZ7_9BACT|nr:MULTISPECIES: chemotaxis protein CheC [Corallococcus]RKH08081.1 fibril biogenesis regulator DifG [Corallococcus sp. CA047B]RKH32337.1 fibril biogenesis regulator DifG [Corallococcus sp. CA031C]RKI07728.1 fibril biogenesis regulator DifG [Corallococcus praedator]
MSPPLPSDAQLDALREVANIGCGHGANALARLMGGRVDLSIPEVRWVYPQDGLALPGEDGPAVAVRLGMTGELRGALVLLLPPRDGEALESVLVRGQPASPEERESALAEAANIIASACLSAIGRLTGWRLLPTVPRLERGPVRPVLAGVLGEVDAGPGPVVVLGAHFTATAPTALGGRMLLVLERGSTQALLARLGL